MRQGWKSEPSPYRLAMASFYFKRRHNRSSLQTARAARLPEAALSSDLMVRRGGLVLPRPIDYV